MGAAWIWGRARWRPTRRRLIALAVLIGLAFGATLAAGAASRRTATALERYAEAFRARDVTWVILDGPPAPAAVDDLPMVESFAPFRGLVGDAGLDQEVFVVGGTDDRYGRDVQRPLLVTGRLPRPDALDEIALEEVGSTRLGAVGDTIELTLASAEDWHAMLNDERGFGRFSGPVVELRVVGIFRTADDIEAEPGTGPGGQVSPAFVEAFDHLGGLRGGVARLEGGDAGMPAFESAVRRLLPPDVPQYAFPGAADVQGATDGARIMASGLWILTGAAAAASMLALGLLLWRLSVTEREQLHVLRALGLRRAETALAATVAVAPALLGGLVLTIGVAVAASPLGPLGVARRAEPHPGVALHLAVVPAALVLVALLVVVVGAAGWFRPRARLGAARRRGAGAGWRWSVALGPAAAVGSQLAIGPRSSRRWATAGGVAVGVAGLAGGAVFAASLGRLVDTPARWGWPADAVLELTGDRLDVARAGLRDDERVDALADATVGFILIGEQQTATYAIEPVRGTWSFTVTDGREPRSPDEIVLGPDALERFGVGVGDTVDALAAGADPGGDTMQLRVVGRGVFPDVDNDPTDAAGMTPAGYATVRQLDTAAGGTNLWLRVAEGVDDDAMLAELAERYPGALLRGGTMPPSQVRHLGRIDAVPWSIAGFLGLLGVAVLAYALVTRSQQARSTLATLRAVGFRPRQLRACVRWQALVLAAVALLAGLPLGAVAGRTTWSLTAGAAGYATDPIAPAASTALITATVLAVTLLVAELPARAAARRAASTAQPVG